MAKIAFIGLGRIGRPMAGTRDWGSKDFSALLDALCETAGLAKVRF